MSKGFPAPKGLRAQEGSKVRRESKAGRASKDPRVRRVLKAQRANKVVRVRQVPAVKQAPPVQPQQQTSTLCGRIPVAAMTGAVSPVNTAKCSPPSHVPTAQSPSQRVAMPKLCRAAIARVQR